MSTVLWAEPLQFFAVWPDDAPGGFGYLVPNAGDVTEGSETSSRGSSENSRSCSGPG